MSSTAVSAALFGALAALFATTRPPADSDMWWHLASGAWMLDHGSILDRDVFSYTRQGTPYASGQWLGQIALELAFRAGGWVGVVALRAALVAVSAFFVARAALRLQPHVGWAAIPILATLLVSSVTWGDRPQLWSVALFPLTLDTVLAVRLGASSRRLLVLPPLFLLWANLHGGFVAGLALLAILTLEALVSRAPSARAIAAASTSALVLSLLNPAGIAAVGSAAAYAGTRAPFIVEERPVSPASGIGITFVALAAAAIVSAVALRSRLREVPAPLLWPALALPFAVLGLTIQRQLPLACTVIAPFVALAVPMALGRARTEAPRLGPAMGRISTVAIGLATGAAVIAGAPRAPDLEGYPAGALPSLATLRGNLFNEYDWGGYLIREAPSHRTFIDGRGALLFVPEVLDDFQRMADARPDHVATLRKWDIAVALIRPDRPLADALQRMGWRVIRRDGARWTLLGRP